MRIHVLRLKSQDSRWRFFYAALSLLLASTLVGAVGVASAEERLPNASPRFKFSIERFYDDKFVSPVAIFYDNEHDELYIIDSSKRDIYIVGPKGAPKFKFGSILGFKDPVDLVVRGERIIVAEQGKAYLTVLNIRGEPVDKIVPDVEDFSPGRMDMDDEGNIFVINTRSNECLVVDESGEFTETVIGSGLNSLVGVAAGKDDVFLITPFYRGKSIHVYKKDGTHRTSFEAIEGSGGTLRLPTSANVDQGGRLWLADPLKGVKVYDKDFKEISYFGADPPAREMISFAFDIDFGRDGMVYIVDKNRGRVSVFK